MNFLAPLFLLGALAIAGPVIFHLIRRTTKDRQRFGSLMFLDPTPPRLTKRSRIEHWLLMLLRAAALGLLALAFARPFFRTPKVLDDSSLALNRTVLLVDTSASMRRTGLWDAAKERAEKIIEEAKYGGVALASFDRSVTPLLNFEDWSRAAMETRTALAGDRLSTAAPTWSGTNAAAALMAAAEMLADSNGGTSGRREIVLITDSQEGSRLEGIQGYEWPKDVRLRIETVAPKRTGNAGLQLAAEARSDEASAVRLRVSNSADADTESFQLGWQGAGGGFDRPAQDVYVPPGQSRIVTLPWPDGFPQPGRVMLKGDAADFDNVVTVAPQLASTVTVIHSGSGDEPRGPLFFLRRALPETRILTAQVVHSAPDSVPSAIEMEHSPLWVITAPVVTQVAKAAAEYAARGGTILVMMPSPGMADTLQTITGSDSLTVTSEKPPSHALLGQIDFGHPLFSAFAEPRFSDFTKIRFWNYVRLDATALPNSRIVAKFDSGDPALLEVPRGKGRVFILAAGWQPDASQLALSSKFPALLASLLAMTGAGARPPAQYFAGEQDFKEPGLQQITKDGQPREVAVNLDPAESRTAPLAVEEFEKLGAPIASAAKPVAPPDAATESLAAATEAEGRQKLWRWLLAAAFAVLFIETLLGIRTARHYSPAEGGSAI